MIEIRIRAFILECERKLTEAGFLLLLRVFTTPTDTPPLLALVRRWLEEVFDRFGLDRVLLILRLGLGDVYRWLEFWDVLRTLGLERDRRGFGFKSACVLLAGTPGDSVKTVRDFFLTRTISSRSGSSVWST
jgi:hypothetical protein